MLSGGGGIDPSPTIDLNVSGIKLSINLTLYQFRERYLQDKRNKDHTGSYGQKPKD